MRISKDDFVKIMRKGLKGKVSEGDFQLGKSPKHWTERAGRQRTKYVC